MKECPKCGRLVRTRNNGRIAKHYQRLLATSERYQSLTKCLYRLWRKGN